ncbi:MAG: hypothetical protein EYC70_04110 [Planctomycetota bacterium]|nr:MAG: hypothetical protein EYC70_04110 [Planctomycetota bacterium]
MPEHRAHASGRKGTPGPALRLRLRWRRGSWELVKQIRLPAKALSDAELLEPRQGQILQGVWYEAVTVEGEVLHRRRVLEALPVSSEVFGDKGEVARVASGPEEFLLDLLVPDDPRIASVRLLASPNPFQRLTRGAGLEVTELAKFRLQARPDRKGDERAR